MVPILHLKAEAENLVHELAGEAATNPFHLEFTSNMMQHSIQQWQTEVEWTNQLRAMQINLVRNS